MTPTDVLARSLRGAAVLCLAALPRTAADRQPPPNPLVASFQKTEQALMDAIATGDKTVWERVLDPSCVLTDEEGKTSTAAEFLSHLTPLPPGLSGGIAVRELTVQELPGAGVSIVRFLADEWEKVFGQRITTQYRITDTFRLLGSSWKMVASHVSVVTQDPPARKVPTDGWTGLAGTYRLLPDGWTFHVVLRDGRLFGGRDPARLKAFIPLTPDAFVLSGSLGEWIFVVGKNGRATRIMNFRKFEPLVWTRVGER